MLDFKEPLVKKEFLGLKGPIDIHKIVDGWPGVQTSWLALSSVGIAADLKMPQEG